MTIFGGRSQSLVFCIILSGAAYAEFPLNFSDENSGKQYTASAGALATNQYLPDPFTMRSGGRVATLEDWSKKRNEIKADLEKWEIGQKPNKPADLTASYSGGQLTVTIKENGKTVTLTSKFAIPSGTGPFPIVIGMNSGTGSLATNLFDGVVQVPFNHDQVATYAMTGNKDLNAPFYKLYPSLSAVGDYAAWSWGVSRIIDGLTLIAEQYHLDMGRIAVTGCSYAGKMALFAGALDERVTLTIAQESGGGGINSWRLSDAYAKRVEDVEKINNTNGSWFMKSLLSQDPYKLPHDHHELIAMIAPRAFLTLGNPGFVWLGDESGYKSTMAALEVWKAMGIEDRFGFDFTGGHDHCNAAANQNTSVTAFIDKFLHNKTVANTTIRVKPANSKFDMDYAKAINWTTPTITSDMTQPSVSFTSPAVMEFESPAEIALSVEASDSDGSISNVDFFNGTQLLRSAMSKPYSFTWKGVQVGSYALKAVATDNEGKTGQASMIIEVRAPQEPYDGKLVEIPGTIEFENYDQGGSGIAYMDKTPGSETSVAFRSEEDVDIEECTDVGGGYNIGWATAGEWLEYTVDVETAGKYKVTIRAACNGSGRTIALTSKGVSLNSAIGIPNTTGWQTYQDVVLENVHLDAGRQTFRVTIGDADYVNLNYMKFELTEADAVGITKSLCQTDPSISVIHDELQVRNIQAGSRIRIYDMQGHFLLELGENGGKLPRRKGPIMVNVIEPSGRVLPTLLMQGR